jgi:hypothetical protein
MASDPEAYNVRAVERAMCILSAFDGEHADRGASEIAQVTGLHKATANRIMMTLLNGGFLERAPDGGRFRLGIRVVELGLGRCAVLICGEPLFRICSNWWSALTKPAISASLTAGGYCM